MSATESDSPTLRLLGREDCPLCDEMWHSIWEAFPQARTRLQKVDVGSRADWRKRFSLRIPVLLGADGRVICEGHLDPEALRKVLA
ncbi:MAG: glutaredoxin family protein [Panacagrimonas sp.]